MKIKIPTHKIRNGLFKRKINCYEKDIPNEIIKRMLKLNPNHIMHKDYLVGKEKQKWNQKHKK